MSTLPKTSIHYYSVEDYLAVDRSGPERFEYLDGQIYQMAGESGAHGDISMNVAGELRLKLKGTSCRVRSKDTKVLSGSVLKKNQLIKGMFSYPDVVVICGEPQYHDDARDVVLNPKIIIEVLSDSTERFDRTDKFTRYRMFNSTLTDYILISQIEPIVEHYVRQDDNTWMLTTIGGTDKTFTIESIGCTLSMLEIYDLIEFPEEILQSLNERLSS